MWGRPLRHSPNTPPPSPTPHLPAQDVVDGDLCEVFAALPPARQRALAEGLQRTPADVLKKLEDVRHKML